MTMDDAAWDRHANPWSLYSRIPILPFLALAIWSRDWIGWWCLVPIGLVVIWTWANPRAFPKPDRFDTWAAKGTRGERVFLARHETPIPEHHRKWALALTWVSAAGLPFFVWGLWVFDLSAVICGVALMLGGKIWFVDRMVWLYEDVTRGGEA